MKNFTRYDFNFIMQVSAGYLEPFKNQCSVSIILLKDLKSYESDDVVC